MNRPKRAWLPPPWELIDQAIKNMHPSRKEYLKIRRSVVAWHRSVLGREEALQMSNIPEQDMKFVDYQLTPDQITDAQAWEAADDTDVDELTNKMLSEGYRISFVYDSKNGCVIVSLIGKSDENPNRGYCMTTRHSTSRRAVALALYKHIMIFDGGAWGEQSPEALFG